MLQLIAAYMAKAGHMPYKSCEHRLLYTILRWPRLPPGGSMPMLLMSAPIPIIGIGSALVLMP